LRSCSRYPGRVVQPGFGGYLQQVTWFLFTELSRGDHVMGHTPADSTLDINSPWAEVSQGNIDAMFARRHGPLVIRPKASQDYVRVVAKGFRMLPAGICMQPSLKAEDLAHCGFSCTYRMPGGLF